MANSRASLNASGSEGSYFPVSIAFTACRETSSRSASSAWLQFRIARSTFSLLFIGASPARSEEHTSELQSLMRISYAVFCFKKKTINTKQMNRTSKRRQFEKNHDQRRKQRTRMSY